MWELTPDNASDYLRTHDWLPREAAVDVHALAWGVSNVVLRVSPAGGTDFVLKQSRERLRTAAPWFSRLDRIYREIDVLQTLGELLPSGSVPRVLLEDRENYLFGMEAAPAAHVVWKERLLAGHADQEIARQLGELLATVHRGTAFRDDLRNKFGDTEVFHQLRLHPFYESLAVRFPDAAGHLQALIAETQRTALCLVLADFSPKNVLLTETTPGTLSSLMLVDFETGHFGDPAFDLGFFLSHLLLKTVRWHRDRFEEFSRMTVTFLNSYWSTLDPESLGGGFARAELERRTWGHLAGCLWARIDGTSPVDYLPEPELQQIVRDVSRGLFATPPRNWAELLERLRVLLSNHSAAASS